MTRLSDDGHDFCRNCNMHGMFGSFNNEEAEIALCFNMDSDHYQHVIGYDHKACHQFKSKHHE